MLFSSLIDIEDKNERDNELRKWFSHIRPGVVIDTPVIKLLVILINLTQKRTDCRDLRDQENAKNLIATEGFIERCVNTVKWQHSHNLKYPDIRVSHQRILHKSEVVIPGLVTGQGEGVNRIDWAHNSADINYAKFFCAPFIWNGQLTNLAMELAAENLDIKKGLRDLGVHPKLIRSFQSSFNELVSISTFPEEVSTYSPQVLMPFFDGYISVTPVVNPSLLAKIQHVTADKKHRYQNVYHTRSSSVGGLVANSGGRIRVLSSIPPVPRYPLSSGKAFKLSGMKGLFNGKALHSKSVQQLLNSLLENESFTSLKEAKSLRQQYIDSLRTVIMEWLMLMVQAKSLSETERAELSLNSELESSLVSQPLSQWKEHVKALCFQFHVDLENSYLTRSFAYHPKLVSLFRHEIEWVINQLTAENEYSQKMSEQHSFIYLKGLRITDASCLSSSYLIGLPSMTALWGWSHNFQRRLFQILQGDMKVCGTALHVSSLNLSKAQMLPEPSVLKSKRHVGGVKRPGVIYGRLGDLTIDLVLAIDWANEFERTYLSERFIDQVKAAIPSRFAGGTMLPPELSSDDYAHWVKHFKNPRELFEQLLSDSSYGKWIKPVVSSEAKHLEELLEDVNSNPDYRLNTLGYQLLEEPKSRKGSSLNYHAYAEAGIGIVDSVSTSKQRILGMENFFQTAFWQLKSTERSMIIKKVDVWNALWNFANN